MRNPLMLALLILGLTSLFMSVLAGVPSLINYQGRLTDDAGEPLDTVVDIQFIISEDSLAGNNLYKETHEDVVVIDGLFSVILGSVQPLDPGIFDGSVRWLGTAIGSGDLGMPMSPIVSSSYAFMSQRSDTASTAESVVSNSITSASILNNTIQPADIKSEPGIAANDNLASLGVNTTYSIYARSTINTPSAGYLVAIATFGGEISSGTGDQTQQVVYGITPDSTYIDNHDLKYWEVPAGVTSSDYWRFPMVTQRVMEISSAGSYSLYLLAKKSYEEPSVGLYYARLVLMFFPTAYGDVDSQPIP